MRLPGRCLALAAVLLGGCVTPHWFDIERPKEKQAVIEQRPITSNRFSISGEQTLAGEIQVILTRDEDTLADVARAYDLGFDEIRAANPDVDPWLPGAGTRVYLPTRFILPEQPREGIVLNVASRRLFYFVPESSDSGMFTVTTNPIGVGRADWATPLGTTVVSNKLVDPTWYPPATIRQEHAESGDPLPAVVPPGPDNPLGEFALLLEMPGYLIHGTNKPYGVGMRISHGCIRLYPEDIELLFGQVDIGTAVTIVNEPFMAVLEDGVIYLEAHSPLEEDTQDRVAAINERLKKLSGDAPAGEIEIDWLRVEETLRNARGLPVAVNADSQSVDELLASARVVRNTIVHVAVTEDELPIGPATAQIEVAPDAGQQN